MKKLAERVGFYLSTTAILLRFKHIPTNLSYYNILRHVSRDSRRCMRCCWKPIRHCFRYHWYHCLTGISSLPGIAASSWYQGSEYIQKNQETRQVIFCLLLSRYGPQPIERIVRLLSQAAMVDTAAAAPSALRPNAMGTAFLIS
jgi:hypothetical protein